MTFVWAVLALLFLLVAGFYSATEMGLYSVNRLRLRLEASRSGRRSAQTLLELTNRREQSVLAVLLTQNVMNYLLTVATVSFIVSASGMPGDRADVYAAIILSPITFVFGDVVPKNWFHAQANRLMYPAAPFIQACVLFFRYTGILWLLESLTRLLAEWTGQEEKENWRGARGEIIGMLRESSAAGPLTEEQARMVERVMNLSSVRVGSIMIPRQLAVTLPADADRRTFEQIVARYNHSRLPVLTPDRRNVMGVVNIYDVLADDRGGPLAQHIRPATFIPARATATQALLQLRQGRENMAIVVDPRRGFVGILTLKDLIEEIFGELGAW
ncbi:MAG TPA: CNNM domain-containing protein [Phycisphaerae bacterium]|nr:CNNM domain-containing protein [Phycisphaerae bacterium]HOJ75867.1 CNNM domain-containing protein [Phycisphaerae bacterium]HOM53286.1 CNNM domain-containing protein [Phycisphaerae bacterium]HON67266.1 CNNM domain-containing protein [Phycisphaerae bacterium]HOQ85553.1 CNNM domain-containing protein [Phycisphaerae bacterium]